MEQSQLAADVIRHLHDVPTEPRAGRYLSLAQAQAIVDATVESVHARDAAGEKAYLATHRKRLAVSLSLIPMAESSDASCIDVGCYGYMAHWCRIHLGYAKVLGIELNPTSSEPIQLRRISTGNETTEFCVHNFDLAAEEWPLDETFDTVLLFETLEHVATDHMRVLLRVKDCMKPNARLVMSVPNAVSYKTLQEFMSGNPPWVYWFFHPDLAHEPRHQFEYTPFFLKFLVRAAGMRELAFRSVFSFVEEDTVQQAIGIGADMGIPKTLFGETIFIQAEKDPAAAVFRFPDILYDADAYYQSIHPLVYDRLSAAFATYHNRSGDLRSEVAQLRAELQQAQIERDQLAAEGEQERTALALARRELEDSQKETLSLRNDLAGANQCVTEAKAALVHMQTELQQTQIEQDRLVAEGEQERGALALAQRELEECQKDMLNLLSSLASANQSVTEAKAIWAHLRAELQHAQIERDQLASEGKQALAALAVARRELEESQKETSNLLNTLEDANQTVTEARRILDAVYFSRSWRLTAPIRRISGGNPRLRRILRKVHRLLRPRR